MFRSTGPGALTMGLVPHFYWLYFQSIKYTITYEEVMAQIYSRWHRFDNNGVKYIKRFELNERPNPSIEPGFTEWQRGTGPHSEQALQNLRIAVQKACKGVPKKASTKEKMRQAKLGVPKTEQHKANMRLSHKLRKEAKNEQSNSLQTTEQEVGVL